MRNTLLATVFTVGVVSGAFGHWTAVELLAIRARTTHAPAINQQWNETEEETRKRMKDFQQRLDNLRQPPSSDSPERLAKEMELQQGIDEILIKYREAEQAKFAPYQVLAGGVAGSLIALIPQLVRRLRSKGSSETAKKARAGAAS